MTARLAYIFSSIGRKQFTALAGLGLCLFVLGHVAGNMLLFVSDKAYNLYGHALTSNPLIYVAEVGLVAIFVGHAVLGTVLALKNRKARQVGYAKSADGDKATSSVSKSLAWQGIVILVFVIFHLITFKYGSHYTVEYDGLVVRDLFRLVVEVFSDPLYVVWYVVAVLILGFHLSHGLGSSFQTLGLNHPKYNGLVSGISLVYGLIIGIGFIAQPIYMFFFYKG